MHLTEEILPKTFIRAITLKAVICIKKNNNKKKIKNKKKPHV